MEHLVFESQRDTCSYLATHKNDCVNLHFHSGFELLYIISGALDVLVDGVWETVSAGEFAIILPNQIHITRNTLPTRHWVCIFREEHVRRFAGLMENKTGVRAKFTCDPLTEAYLKGNVLANELLTSDVPDDQGRVMLKLDGHPKGAMYLLQFEACLSAICACYLEQAGLTVRKQSDTTLKYRLLAYITDHYRENVTLGDVAKALGYSENYLSQQMRRLLGTGFRQFLNWQRLAYAQELMRTKTMPIAEIAKQSGFGSERNFYITHKNLTGKTPAEME